MASLTFQDIFDFVDNVLPKDGWKPNRAAVMAQCNAALDRFYCRDGVWRNKTDLSGKNRLHIPIDCMMIDRIYFDGGLLEKLSQHQIAESYGYDYATVTGTPEAYALLRSEIDFNCLFTSCAVDTIQIEGVMNVGRFSEDPTVENPLLYIPQRYQMLPAYYALAFGTINANDPSMVDIKNTYRQLWETEYREMMAAIDLRSGGEFIY